MRKSLITAVVLFSAVTVVAQSNSDKILFSWYGFVNNQFCSDSRLSLQGAADLFNILPFDQKIDDAGNDINNRSKVTMLAITTRLGVRLAGPDIWNARSLAQIEADFTGFSGSTTMFFVRQANFKLDWSDKTLTVGQTWHPILGDLFPEVIGISMGAPFNPFNRTPQIRYDQKFGTDGDIILSGAAMYQFQYASIGPNGRSFEYQKYSMLPEVYIGLIYKNEGFMAGVGIDWSRVAPRTTVTVGIVERKITEYVSGFSGMAQASYKNRLLSVKAKALLGENMSQFGIPTGYGATNINADGSFNYAPLRTLSAWAIGLYGAKLKGGLFAGYMKNLGAGETLLPTGLNVFGGGNIDRVCRLSPQLVYSESNISIGAEFEITAVAYGSIQSNGTVNNTHWVSNNRFLLSATYSF